MPRHYVKTKNCGCVVKATTCGTKKTPDGKMYLLGGHKHLVICDNCKKMEDLNEDTLHDMWMVDNMTDDLGYAEWKQYDAKDAKDILIIEKTI
jgi:hypothetical protein